MKYRKKYTFYSCNKGFDYIKIKYNYDKKVYLITSKSSLFIKYINAHIIKAHSRKEVLNHINNIFKTEYTSFSNFKHIQTFYTDSENKYLLEYCKQRKTWLCFLTKDYYFELIKKNKLYVIDNMNSFNSIYSNFMFKNNIKHKNRISSVKTLNDYIDYIGNLSPELVKKKIKNNYVN